MSSFYLVQEEDGTSKLLLEDDTGAILLEVILVGPTRKVGGHPRHLREGRLQQRRRLFDLASRRRYFPPPAPEKVRVPVETVTELLARARAESLLTLTEEGEEILALALLGML